MSSGCRKCGKPAYIKPDGSAAFLCPDCIMAGLEDLGIFPKEKAVEQSRALDGAYCACKIFIPSAFYTVPVCRICGKPPRQ